MKRHSHNQQKATINYKQAIVLKTTMRYENPFQTLVKRKSNVETMLL